MESHIRLIEHEEVDLERELLSDAEAFHLNRAFPEQVSVTWASPLTGHRWRLKSHGWVGFLPLGPGRGIVLQPKVPLKNLFRMLEYAFDLRSLKLPPGTFHCDSIQEFFERLANQLSGRILARARQGLYRAYLPKQESLQHLRGRIDIPALMQAPFSTSIACAFEEQSADVPENRIVAWTLHRILQSGACTERFIGSVRQADRMLRGTTSLYPCNGEDCIDRSYDRLNEDYRSMHLLCRFFLDCLGPAHVEGTREMLPILIDMSRLFEVFAARWIEENIHPDLSLASQEYHAIGGGDGIRLNPDLVLRDRRTGKILCVLDTKYKARGAVSSQDYAQVVAYADALHCDHSILIYPKSLGQPFDARTGRIRVRSAVFDLDGELDAAGSGLLRTLYETAWRFPI